MVTNKQIKETCTLGGLYQLVKGILKEKDPEGYEYESRLILSSVLEMEPIVIFAKPEKRLDPKQVAQCFDVAKGRAAGMPLQYLLGKAMFMGLEWNVNKSVLIPRPDTEILVEEALNRFKDQKGLAVLDMGTGSGCIAVSLALFLPGCSVDAVDISREALETAKGNALLHGVAERVRFIQGDLFQPAAGEPELLVYDLIISNPPYISEEAFLKLDEEVRCHEPEHALKAEDDGMAFYHRILNEGTGYIRPGGCLMVETGYDQGQKTAKLMASRGFSSVRILKDYSGVERVVTGIKSFAMRV